jgi:multidrug resistance protein, MATE family
VSDAAQPRAQEVTHRRVLAIALPMTLSHLTTPLLGLVDATVIGRLGEAHLLGAVALGAVVFDFLFWSFGALRMGTAGLTAQAVGAGDGREVDRALARGLAVALAAGLLILLLQWPIGQVAFRLAGASEAVTDALAIYFAVRVWAAPFTLANYAILGSLLGRGRTDIGLVLQVGINVANIALTILFVVGLGMGVAGAALATVIAEVAGVGLGFLLLRRLGSNPFRVSRAEVFARAAMLQTLAVNRDIMIRTIALVLAFALFTTWGARTGDVTLAANAVLYNIFLLGSFFLDGFATAAEALCGQAVGARDRSRFRRAALLSLEWSVGFGLAVSVLFYVGGALFIDFVSTNAEVRAHARTFLPYAALTPLAGSVAFAFDGIYIGATWTRAMRDLMLLAFTLYVAVLVGAGALGNHGLWLAFLAFLAVRGTGQALLFPRLSARTFS